MDFAINFENSNAFWVYTEKYSRNKSIAIFLLGYLNMDYQVKKLYILKLPSLKKKTNQIYSIKFILWFKFIFKT